MVCLAAYFAQIWIDDDGHQVTPQTQQQTLVAQITESARWQNHNKNTSKQPLGGVDLRGTGQYFLAACSSKTDLVRPTGLESVASCSEGNGPILSPRPGSVAMPWPAVVQPIQSVNRIHAANLFRRPVR